MPPESAGRDGWRLSHDFVRLVGGRWTLALLAELIESGRRYQELQDALDGISLKMLTETLRRAERDGLIIRQLDSERVETAALYELTDLGRSLGQPLAAVGSWTEGHWRSVEAAPPELGYARGAK